MGGHVDRREPRFDLREFVLGVDTESEGPHPCPTFGQDELRMRIPDGAAEIGLSVVASDLGQPHDLDVEPEGLIQICHGQLGPDQFLQAHARSLLTTTTEIRR
ncbi:hypothetical protein [Pseudonocardia yunnanensis]|uniref:Uncharacterized protein n=1 Tax=Pseudonocardia yunnanensis TaxID=58107 RepID=A0ABW4EPK5_9PSEU